MFVCVLVCVHACACVLMCVCLYVCVCECVVSVVECVLCVCVVCACVHACSCVCAQIHKLTLIPRCQLLHMIMPVKHTLDLCSISKMPYEKGVEEEFCQYGNIFFKLLTREIMPLKPLPS